MDEERIYWRDDLEKKTSWEKIWKKKNIASENDRWLTTVTKYGSAKRDEAGFRADGWMKSKERVMWGSQRWQTWIKNNKIDNNGAFLKNVRLTVWTCEGLPTPLNDANNKAVNSAATVRAYSRNLVTAKPMIDWVSPRSHPCHAIIVFSFFNKVNKNEKKNINVE